MQFNVIGKELPRHDVNRQVMGKLKFSADMDSSDMLYAKALRSEYAHAEIVSIDTSRAEELNGVKAVITGKDIPHNAFGFTHKEQPVIAEDRVRYPGDPVAVVAAETEEIAEEALGLIEVEYEELPVITDPYEAMEEDAFPIHGGGNVASHLKIRKGDVEAGFKDADYIFEDTIKTPMVEHAHIEPHAATAVVDEDDRLKVVASVQRPFLCAADISKTLKLPMSRIRVIAPAIGGGFGGKNEITIEPIVSLLALKTGRPVRMEYTREEEFIASTVRHPYIIEYKTGVNRDGKMIARQAKIISNSGAYVSWGESTLTKALIHCCGPYQIPNLRVDCYLVYTNTSVGGAMRGFGVTQVGFGYENHTDAIARALDIDPVKFRENNIYEENCKNATGQTLHNVTLSKVLKKAAEMAEWGEADEGGG